ncbi:MAG TPA: dihydroorotate dehydrogenase electron transfer subunit [Gammaproteobacteria bacterium]|nr:dihydroorotate dehydrogenase electron transfer subunit [Gammaproteobacteria bacterium]
MAERGYIHVVAAEVLAHERHAAGQHVLRLAAPAIAAGARPGSFVHIDCGPQWLLRRPMSLMSAAPANGEIELLFKEIGHGTVNLAALEPGDAVSLIGPIGNAFTSLRERPRRLLLGGGVGIPPILYYAQTLVAGGESPPWVVTGSEVPFPFLTARADLPLPGAPAAASDSISRLEALGVPNRLASLGKLPGCFHGFVTELAQLVIEALNPDERDELALYACGPTAMLAATAALARRYVLPCQVALEEYMACAVGGCAGCTVEVTTATGAAMKRVCVDGPVFDAAAVFPAVSPVEPREPIFD